MGSPYPPCTCEKCMSRLKGQPWYDELVRIGRPQPYNERDAYALLRMLIAEKKDG